jgi:drug/metabolite transporter (DMT)-like permease
VSLLTAHSSIVRGRHPLLVHGRLTVAMALWGLSFTANHELLRSLDPTQVITLRFLLAAVSFALVLGAVPAFRPSLRGRDWVIVVACGLLSVPAMQMSMILAQTYVTPAVAAMLAATAPIFIAVVAALALAERMSYRAVAGIAMAMGGAVLVVLAASGERTDVVSGNPWGAGLVLVAQLTWALYTVLSKPLVVRQPPIGIIGATVIAGTLAMTPLTPHALADAGSLGAMDWGWLVYLAVGGTLIPYLIWFSSLGHMDANQVAVYMYLVPLCALIWSAVLVSSVPSLVAIIGGIVIISGVALTQAGKTDPELVPSETV